MGEDQGDHLPDAERKPDEPSGGDTTSAADRPSAVPWPPILLVAVIASAVFLGNVYPLPWPGVDDLGARLIGLSLGAAGLALIIWAALTLRRHATTILPHQAADKLVTEGPFAWRRNPIYLGDALLMLGAAEVTKNIWFAALVPVFMILVTWLAILPEERHLAARFGQAWEDYKERTRRLL